MKKAKDYYNELAEGLRLTVCGGAMLAICGIKSACHAVRGLIRKGGSQDGEAIDVTAEVRDCSND